MHDQLLFTAAKNSITWLKESKPFFFLKEREASTSGYSESEAQITEVSSEHEHGECLREEHCELISGISSCVPCECQCCTNITIPYHPMDVSDSKVSHAHHSNERKGKVKAYSRKIKPSWYENPGCWYEKYPWISVCTSKFRVFCTILSYADMLSSKTLSVKVPHLLEKV